MLDILSKAGSLICKGVDTPMETDTKLLPDREGLGLSWKISFIGWNLNYLMVTGSNVSFVVSLINQFLPTPMMSHLNATTYILGCLKKNSRQ